MLLVLSPTDTFSGRSDLDRLSIGGIDIQMRPIKLQTQLIASAQDGDWLDVTAHSEDTL
jgi:hypothetical protein